MREQIFVQIASYRDVELPATIESALASAEHPDRLTFGICWQYDEQTYLDLDPYMEDPRFRITPTHYSASRGCCWARNQTNRLYEGEPYTLQIDAHTRFRKNWDSQYITMLDALDGDKPLLSTYPAPFEYVDGREIRLNDRGMQRLFLSRICRELSTVFGTELVQDRSHPAASQFLGAGQIFTVGKFCTEVEYDPDLYFGGEEISLSARAYTHGYDFYCPNEDLVWHLYKHSMRQHGADHQQTQQSGALARLRALFSGDHASLGKYGLGDVRSLAEFERHADINFRELLEEQRS